MGNLDSEYPTDQQIEEMFNRSSGLALNKIAIAIIESRKRENRRVSKFRSVDRLPEGAAKLAANPAGGRTCQ